MNEEQIRKLVTRLLISFLTKQWRGRSHDGLVQYGSGPMVQVEVEMEVERFVKQFVEL